FTDFNGSGWELERHVREHRIAILQLATGERLLDEAHPVNRLLDRRLESRTLLVAPRIRECTCILGTQIVSRLSRGGSIRPSEHGGAGKGKEQGKEMSLHTQRMTNLGPLSRVDYQLRRDAQMSVASWPGPEVGNQPMN